jgi:hypothetical protein
LVVAVVLPALAVLLSRLPVNDLAYLLRAGDFTLNTGHVLRADLFTFTMNGQPWTDQQWGAASILAALFRLGGWRGLVVLRACLTSFAIAFTYRRTFRMNGDPLVSGCLSIGAFLVAITLPGTFSLRPQLLAVPLLAGSVSLIGDRETHPAGLAWLLPIGVLWANIHGSFVLLPLLLLIAFVDDVVSRRPTWRWTGCLVVVTVLTPLASPWGSGVYSYLWTIATSSIVRDVIDEWKPLASQFPAWVLFLVFNVTVLVAAVRHRSRPLSVEEVMTLVIFTALPIWSGRNLVWWVVAVPPVGGALLASWHPGERPAGRVDVILSLTLGAVLLLSVGRVLTTRPPELLLSEAPSGITEAVRGAAHPGVRVFDGRWGSWFEFATPSLPMFVDSRAELFPDAVWHDYFQVSEAQAGWQTVLDDWNVDIVVAADDHDAALIDALEHENGWKLVYRDVDGAVFTRVP